MRFRKCFILVHKIQKVIGSVIANLVETARNFEILETLNIVQIASFHLMCFTVNCENPNDCFKIN